MVDICKTKKRGAIAPAEFVSGHGLKMKFVPPLPMALALAVA